MTDLTLAVARAHGQDGTFQTGASKKVAEAFDPRELLSEDWNPDLHPRDEHGRFSSGGSGGGAEVDFGRGVRALMSGAAYNNIFDEEYALSMAWKAYSKKWAATLSAPEKQAFKDYTEGTSLLINTHLRDGDSSSDQETVLHMDAALANAKLPSAVVAYRSAPLDFMQVMHPGDVITDKAFVSTSLFVTSKMGGHDVNIAVHIPEGAHAAYIQALSEYPEEAEVLLPRNSQFRVRSVGHGSSLDDLVHMDLIS